MPPVNYRNAGTKPKYKEGIETITIHRLVPKDKVSQIDEAIEKIVEQDKR